jgi:hypothetical protein
VWHIQPSVLLLLLILLLLLLLLLLILLLLLLLLLLLTMMMALCCCFKAPGGLDGAEATQCTVTCAWFYRVLQVLSQTHRYNHSEAERQQQVQGHWVAAVPHLVGLEARAAAPLPRHCHSAAAAAAAVPHPVAPRPQLAVAAAVVGQTPAAVRQGAHCI